MIRTPRVTLTTNARMEEPMYLLRHAPYLARMMDASSLKRNAAVQKDFMEMFANVSSDLENQHVLLSWSIL